MFNFLTKIDTKIILHFYKTITFLKKKINIIKQTVCLTNLLGSKLKKIRYFKYRVYLKYLNKFFFKLKNKLIIKFNVNLQKI